MPVASSPVVVKAAPSGAANRPPLKFQAKCVETNRAEMPITLDEPVEELDNKGAKITVMKPHRVMRNMYITSFTFKTLGDVTNIITLQTLEPSGFELGKEYEVQLSY